MVRPWPGNVRELLREARTSAQEALAAGHTVVTVRELSPQAGMALRSTAPPPTSSPQPPNAELTRERIEGALREVGGNVTGAARALGMHRTQLRRWLVKNGLSASAFGGAADDDEGNRADDL